MDNSYVTVDPCEEIVDHVSFGFHTAEIHTPQIAVRTPNAGSVGAWFTPEIRPTRLCYPAECCRSTSNGTGVNTDIPLKI